MTQQPEALRLAEKMESYSLRSGYAWHCHKAAAELRRLHEENEHNYATSVNFAKEFAKQHDRIITLEAELRQAESNFDVRLHTILFGGKKPSPAPLSRPTA